eukprot:m.239637 g.239637  ORF g.239637 m.239637 type:complete len:99 (-) comp22520_c3_seq16:31-327(-)
MSCARATVLSQAPAQLVCNCVTTSFIDDRALVTCCRAVLASLQRETKNGKEQRKNSEQQKTMLMILSLCHFQISGNKLLTRERGLVGRFHGRRADSEW